MAGLEVSTFEASFGVLSQLVQSVKATEVAQIMQVVWTFEITLAQSLLEIPEGNVSYMVVAHFDDVKSIFEVGEVFL